MSEQEETLTTVQSTFSFRVRDAGGEILTGSMVAASAEEVASRLRAEGKFILSVGDKPLPAETDLDEVHLRRGEAAKRVRKEDVIGFCQQLSIMLETGVPLTEALDAFCCQVKRKEFRDILVVLRDDIHSGELFSNAMAKWPRVFPNMMISLMQASEASGTMALMLGRIGEYLAKERRTAKQIKGALSYPMFMMTAGIVMSAFLMVFVLPRFATIYEGRSATLPAPTRILLGASEFIMTQYLVYGPILAVLIIGGAIWIHYPSGKRCLDWMRLNLPILRSMYGQLYITRSTRTMGTLLTAGVNLLDIINICRGVTGNAYYHDLWDDVEKAIRDGRQFSEAMFEAKFIPPNVSSMIASGERSGRLADVMERIAEFSEEELDTAVKQVTAYIEPIAIMCMGVVVGGVALALLLPIFSMGNVVAGGG
ncbi:MAG: type II secretion system F family protein [Phycisphaerales bacterium]|nr:MAG: type II secretion system F family protein [Phycisphaerales bacterium]